MLVTAADTHALRAAIDRTTNRFARAGATRWQYYYVRSKLSRDPSSHAVVSLGPLGDVLDLGCGRGQLDVMLIEAGVASSVRGFDWDVGKLDLARRAARGLPASFEPGDVRRVAATAADSVLLIDVLHYFHIAAQNALLARAADLVRPGGRLIIRDADAGRGWRTRATKIGEQLTTAVRFNRGERVVFRDIAGDVVPRLAAHGLTCVVSECWGSTPFSNVLVVATKST